MVKKVEFLFDKIKPKNKFRKTTFVLLGLRVLLQLVLISFLSLFCFFTKFGLSGKWSRQNFRNSQSKLHQHNNNNNNIEKEKGKTFFPTTYFQSTRTYICSHRLLQTSYCLVQTILDVLLFFCLILVQVPLLFSGEIQIKNH